MTRHLTDTDRHTTERSSRLARFIQMDRKQQPDAATLELQRAPRTHASKGRPVAFARIERGQET